MSDPLLSQVSMFGCNFAPRSWAVCQGQLVDIQSNTALYSLLGTFYGGDGRNTFGIPDLRGRTAIGIGQGPGLSYRQIGQRGGWESVQLTQSTLPAHTHTGDGQATSTASLSGTPNTSATVKCNNTTSNTNEPLGKVWGTYGGRENLYADDIGEENEMHAGLISVSVDLSPVTVNVDTTIDSIGINSTGGNLPHVNMSPYLVVNYCIITQGVFPSRN
ncbi:MAG: phage tail protein [bacterium]|nr:phage tail protein [bacterium]